MTPTTYLHLVLALCTIYTSNSYDLKLSMAFIKYGGMSFPFDEAIKWGHRLNPNIEKEERERRIGKSYLPRRMDESEEGIALRIRWLAYGEAKDYVESQRGQAIVIAHPFTNDTFVIIPTRSATEWSATSSGSSFTWFMENARDADIRMRLEAQGVQNVEYITALKEEK